MNENNGRLVFLLVWCWLQVYPRCWLLVVSPLGADSKQGLGADGFRAWCWLQARPRCWLLGHILLFFRYFNFVLVVLRQNFHYHLQNQYLNYISWRKWQTRGPHQELNFCSLSFDFLDQMVIIDYKSNINK